MPDQANNVEVIVERMMTYLRTAATDEHIKKDIVRKVWMVWTAGVDDVCFHYDILCLSAPDGGMPSIS